MSNSEQDKPRLLPVARVIGEDRKKTAAFGEDEDIYAARAKMLDAAAPSESLILPDAKHGAGFVHAPVDPNAHISQKAYFFPPEFHALRKELEDNYREFFITTNPLTNTSPAWCMVFDAPQFIGYCNGATGLAVQLDTGDVAGICKTFLNAFRKMRGVGEIQ